MRKINSYQLVTIIVLAIISQLIVSRLADAAAFAVKSSNNVAASRHVTANIAVAPQNVLLSSQIKEPAVKKHSDNDGKPLDHDPSNRFAPVEPGDQTVDIAALRLYPGTRLWLLYRTLLL